MKRLYKRGSSFVEVILAVIFMGVLSIIILNTSMLFVFNTDTKIASEINLLTGTYLNKAKSDCDSLGEFSTTESNIILSNIPINVSYGCTFNNNNLYTLNVSILYKGKTKNASSYFFKQI